MTNKQFKSIAEQLNRDIGGLRVKGSLVVFPSTSEILKGLTFQGSGFDATHFFVSVFFMPLCVPSKYLALNLGFRIGGRNRKWNFSDPLLNEKLLLSVQTEAIPFMKQIETVQLAIQFAKAKAIGSKSYYELQASAYLLPRSGEIAQAICSLDLLLSSLDVNVSWQLQMATRAGHLKHLLTTSPLQAMLQLVEWEQETIENLKIGDLIG